MARAQLDRAPYGFAQSRCADPIEAQLARAQYGCFCSLFRTVQRPRATGVECDQKTIASFWLQRLSGGRAEGVRQLCAGSVFAGLSRRLVSRSDLPRSQTEGASGRNTEKI